MVSSQRQPSILAGAATLNLSASCLRDTSKPCSWKRLLYASMYHLLSMSKSKAVAPSFGFSCWAYSVVFIAFDVAPGNIQAVGATVPPVFAADPDPHSIV
ncbi:hypothetical protein Tco_0845913 [Tanacetum coccineum]